MKKIFEEVFRNWTEIAYREWNYDTSLELYYQGVFSRLSAGLRTILGYGINRGFITQQGKEFLLRGLHEKKTL